MQTETLDFIGDPAVIAKVAALAKSEGLLVSEPMQTESISDALDAPFGAEEIRQVCEVITVVMGAGVSVTRLLIEIKKLLPQIETTNGKAATVEARRTSDQKIISKVSAETDLSDFPT
jgi:hypothetical protein